LVNLLRGAVDSAADDSGWANLGRVGSSIVNQAPEFDPRNYGFKKLGELIDATKLFEMDARATSEGGQRVVYVKDKRR
jgi:hypothetical protein